MAADIPHRGPRCRKALAGSVRVRPPRENGVLCAFSCRCKDCALRQLLMPDTHRRQCLTIRWLPTHGTSLTAAEPD